MPWTKVSPTYVHAICFAAQFLYPRESRETPSLLSYIDVTAGGPTVNRSVPEPYQPQFKSKEITCTSSLSSSSGNVSTVTTTEGVKAGTFVDI